MSSDYQLEDTVFLPFTTRAFATGIPTALVSGEVQIYEDASITQITAAETLAVSLDGVAGFNMVTVVATAANGFGAGQSYTLILSAGTVDSVSVIGEVVGHFTLDMSAAAKDLANGTDGLGAIKAETATILVDTGTTLDAAIAVIDTNVDQIETAVITNAAGVDIAADIIAMKAETVLIVADTNELQTDDVPGLIAALNDPTAAVVADAVWDELTTDHITVNTFGQRLSVLESGTAVAATASTITLDAGSSELADFHNDTLIVITAGTGAGQARFISDYAVTTNVATVSANWITTPSTDSVYYIIPFGLVNITQAAADKVWSSATRTLTAFSTALALSVWDVLESAVVTASSIGLKVKNNLDAAITTRATPAQVNTEVLDVMNVDTITLPGQEAPPLTPTHRQATAWLFKAFRNRKDQTATLWQLYADNETTVDAKATVSDAAGTAIKQEIVTGP